MNKEYLRILNIGILLFVSGILILNGKLEINLGWGLGWGVGTFLSVLRMGEK